MRMKEFVFMLNRQEQNAPQDRETADCLALRSFVVSVPQGILAGEGARETGIKAL